MNFRKFILFFGFFVNQGLGDLIGFNRLGNNLFFHQNSQSRKEGGVNFFLKMTKMKLGGRINKSIKKQIHSLFDL